ncbi:MAG: hypothetical protein IIA89_02745 [Chloroflexi bacterium]|nr:hypothetical protein [Chloroflexota bacterium]
MKKVFNSGNTTAINWESWLRALEIIVFKRQPSRHSAKQIGVFGLGQRQRAQGELFPNRFVEIADARHHPGFNLVGLACTRHGWEHAP